ncbi:MAG: caspase family protein [Saprospiraceae bacterium]
MEDFFSGGNIKRSCLFHKASSFHRRSVLLSLLIFSSLSMWSQPQIKGVKPLANITKKDTGTFRAVIVGISDYQNSKIPDLSFAHKDAEAFYNYLLHRSGLKIDSANVVLLLNEKATAGNVISNLFWLMDESKEGDVAIIYFSGHGDVETTTMNQPGFLLCYDAPARVYMAGGTFALQNLQDIIATLSTTNKTKVLVITDACRAGKLAGSTEGGPRATAANLAKQYANENKILSCQENEFSLEGKSWGGGRGVFSYYFLHGIEGLADRNKDGYVSVQEIERYLDDEVPAAVAPHSQFPITVGNKTNLIAKVDPKILAELKSEIQKNGLEQSSDRGILDFLEYSSDTLIQHWYQGFNMALREHRLLYPENNSAWYYFLQLKDKPEMMAFKGLMQRNLAAALQDDAQQAINDYLKADPVELRKRWSYDIRYERYPEYLTKSAELLGEKHFYFTTISARQHYFEGLNLRLQSERTGNKALIQQALLQQEACLTLESNAPFAFNEIGILYRRLSKYKEAVEQFEKVVKMTPTWPLPWANLCGTYVELDELDKAEACGIKAIQLDSGFALSYYNLGYVYQVKKENQKAKSFFINCLEADSEYKDAYFKLAFMYATEGNYAEAEKMALQYHKRDSTYIYNLINLGEIKFNLKKIEEAELFYNKALEHNPNSEFALEELAKFYLSIQLFTKADMHLYKLDSLQNKNANTYYLISKSKAMQNNKKECLHYLNMALENGYKDLDSILNDQAFTKISKKRSFKELMKRFFEMN